MLCFGTASAIKSDLASRPILVDITMRGLSTRPINCRIPCVYAGWARIEVTPMMKNHCVLLNDNFNHFPFDKFA